MTKRSPAWFLLFTMFLLLILALVSVVNAEDLSPKEQLGKTIFFDTALSAFENQSCASCHDPEWGWTGPDSNVNIAGAVYEGSIKNNNSFGNRKPPSAAYATRSPIFHFSRGGLFIGGNFWDGRATGEKLGNPAADQAQGPFLNTVEQALTDVQAVVTIVCTSTYADLFKEVWGHEVCDAGNEEDAFYDIALSIAAYEASSEVNAFSSKYDLTFTGKSKLTKQEQKGFALFKGKGKCKLCHVGDGQHALFTDYSFDNLGLPKNPENPFYVTDPDFIDSGLGGFLLTRQEFADMAAENMGKHKVPTLRNVDKRPGSSDIKAYGHNGYFKSLEGIVHFYNTRDVKEVCPDDYTEEEALVARCWPAPEVADNVNFAELGDLGLSPEEEAAIAAFLKTLSDGAVPEKEK